MSDLEDAFERSAMINPEPVPVEEVELVPANIIGRDVKDSQGSQVWNEALSGQGDIYDYSVFPHLRVLFGPWLFPKQYRVKEAWPKIVYWLTIWLLVNWFLSFSWLVIMVPTIIKGDFNVEMNFTTDFLSHKHYPDKVDSVGNVKFGWFFMAMFLWQFIVLSVLLFFKGIFFRYIRIQLSYRYDLWRFIIHIFTIPLLMITVCGMVGITNVFTIIAMVMLTMFYWMFTHYAPEHHVSNLLFVLLHLNPRYGGREGLVEAKDQTLMDGETEALDGSKVNGGFYGAVSSPLIAAKTLSHIVNNGKELTEYDKDLFYEEYKRDPNYKEGMLFNVYRTGQTIAHWFDTNTHYIFAIPVTGWFLILILAPIAYFGGALGSDTSTFHWWAYIPIWAFVVALFVDLIWTFWYWHLKWNQKHVVHKQASSEEEEVVTVELLITAFHNTMFSLTFWTIVQVFISFTLLGGAWNMPGNLIF